MLQQDIINFLDQHFERAGAKDGTLYVVSGDYDIDIWKQGTDSKFWNLGLFHLSSALWGDAILTIEVKSEGDLERFLEQLPFLLMEV